MFYHCRKFRFCIRVIYGTTEFIKSVFKLTFSFSYVLKITAATLNNVHEFFSVTCKFRFNGALFTCREES